jgi:hypothetical protein
MLTPEKDQAVNMCIPNDKRFAEWLKQISWKDSESLVHRNHPFLVEPEPFINWSAYKWATWFNKGIWVFWMLCSLFASKTGATATKIWKNLVMILGSRLYQIYTLKGSVKLYCIVVLKEFTYTQQHAQR